MKRLSIVRLQEAYLKMPSSVLDACFPVAARRISIAKEEHPCNALFRAIQSKSKLPFLSNGRDKVMAYLL